MPDAPPDTSHETRVLIADDSATVRHYLRQLIDAADGLRVVGMASDGVEALDLLPDTMPDVISMDITMPRLNGLEATERIMQQQPTPVVVVSGKLQDDVELSMQALEAGAVAVVAKPVDRNHADFARQQRQLLKTLRAMAQVKVISRRRVLVPIDIDADPALTYAARQKRRRPRIVAIGASTGGPTALHSLLCALPADFPLPIVVAQHMPPDFLPGLVRWLDTSCALRVCLADGDALPQAGTVYIAPGDKHLALRRHRDGTRLHLLGDAGAPHHFPSVNVLFESVALHYGGDAVGVLLTGMGDDGAAGLLALRHAGAPTLVQDEASCTVFGMPRAAIARGAASEVLSLADLPAHLLKLV